MDPPRLAVGAVLLEGTGGETRVLLVKRGRPPGLGRWSLPGGRVEHGETLEAALVREMREETGLEVEVGPLVLIAELIDPNGPHYVVLDYACARVGGALAAGDDAAAVELVPVADLEARGVTALVREAVLKARERRDAGPSASSMGRACR